MEKVHFKLVVGILGAFFLFSCSKHVENNLCCGSNVTFKGIVTDSYTGLPIPGIGISVFLEKKWVTLSTTDNSGNYSVSFFDSGSINSNTAYAVMASCISNTFSPNTTTIQPFKSKLLNFVLNPMCKFYIHAHNIYPINLNDKITFLNLNGISSDSISFIGNVVDTSFLYLSSFGSPYQNSKSFNLFYRINKNGIQTNYNSIILLKESLKSSNTSSSLNFIVCDTINY